MATMAPEVVARPLRPASGRFHEDFPLTRVLSRLARAARQWRVPAMEVVAGRGGDAFGVLVGTLLSLRTRDETTLPACRRLRAIASTPQALAVQGVQAIAKAIYPVAFYRVKARRLKAVARLLLERHGGAVPDDLDALLALPGVGRKTANLTLGLAFGIPAVGVDIHVHRILNRLGALSSRTPDQTERLLRANLPRRWWLRVNAILVPFGQAICTPQSPWCSRCPVAAACRRAGVGRWR